MNALLLEARKIKRHHYWLLAAGGSGLMLVWVSVIAYKRTISAEEIRLLGFSLGEVLQLMSMLGPILAALLASRLVTVDTEERMGQLFNALGQKEGTRFTAKLIVGALTLSLGQMLILATITLGGTALGLRSTAEVDAAILPMAIVLTCACFSSMAVQLVLATSVPKQGIGLGVGIIGGLFASALQPLNMPQIGWLLPWGITAAGSPINNPASLQAKTVVMVTNPWLGALLAILATIAWTFAARLFIGVKARRA